MLRVLIFFGIVKQPLGILHANFGVCEFIPDKIVMKTKNTKKHLKIGVNFLHNGAAGDGNVLNC